MARALGLRITFSGPFDEWSSALEKADGYDASLILETTLKAALRARQGIVKYERDSVEFDEIEYSWPLLAFLMWSLRHKKSLNVLDFGGSLGTSYFQNQEFFDTSVDLSWTVVEQPHFVDAGSKYIQNKQLTFESDLKSYFASQTPDIILLSSVLHYLQDPYLTLELMAYSGAPLILIDRTILNRLNTDKVFIQKNPKTIYDISYPVWSLSQQKIISFMEDHGYILWHSFAIDEFSSVKEINSEFMGLAFRPVNL